MPYIMSKRSLTMDEKQINIFDGIFGALDEALGEDTDGLKILGAILALPEENFEKIKPVLYDEIQRTFDLPESQLAFAQMVNANGVRVEDFTENLETIIDEIGNLTIEDGELTEGKKDFLKFVVTSFVNSLELSKGIAHRIISIPIELCRENAKLPTYATSGSAAMDIYSPEEYTINPGESIMIPTGLKVNIPNGYALLIQPRSGLSRKSKLRIPNAPGLIDSDYHEEIGVLIENIDLPVKEYGVITLEDGTVEENNLYGSSFTIGKGERFAQMRLVEVPAVNWLEVKSLGEFENDHGEGFGSTGTN